MGFDSWEDCDTMAGMNCSGERRWVNNGAPVLSPLVGGAFAQCYMMTVRDRGAKRQMSKQ